MLIPFCIVILIMLIVHRVFDLAGLLILFIFMKTAFDIIANISLRKKKLAEHNEAVRLANQAKMESRKKRESKVSLDDVMRRIRAESHVRADNK